MKKRLKHVLPSHTDKTKKYKKIENVVETRITESYGYLTV